MWRAEEQSLRRDSGRERVVPTGAPHEDQSLNRASAEPSDSIRGVGEGHPRAVLPHGFVAVSLSHIPAAAALQPSAEDSHP